MQLLQQRVDGLDEDVRMLRQEIGSLAASRSAARRGEAAASPELRHTAERLAQELGFKLLSNELESDPDCLDSTYYVLNVEAVGTPEELIARQLKWHEALEGIDSTYRGRVRICIFPTP
jgi:hypothetical protein